MGKRRAMIVIFLATAILLCAVCGALMAAEVDGGLIAVAFVVIAGTGSDLLSRAVMHYGALEEREQREATLLKPR